MNDQCPLLLKRLCLTILLPGLLPLSPAGAQFYGDPPDDNHPWAVHDSNRPQPPRVEPGSSPGAPPSDAVVLFDGTRESLSNWKHLKDNRKADWQVVDGALQCSPGAGYIATREEFGDCQLHIEWAAPAEVKGTGQGRGNSGVFLMGQVEVQILDNYNNPSYPDGSAGSVYGIMPPAANALNPPGEWQSYDIIFRRPIVRDGQVLDPGHMTVLMNGVVVQAGTPLEGPGGHKKRSRPMPFAEKGHLKLQDHGNPVRFRNIWYRPLRLRPLDGGTDGTLSRETTLEKRREIASQIRNAAEPLQGKERMLKLMEALYYESREDTLHEINQLAEAYLADLAATPADRMAGRKNEVLHVGHAAKYLVNHKRLPADHAMHVQLQQIINQQGWARKG